jgi:hypothetical protein
MKHHTQQNNTKFMPMTTIHEQEPPLCLNAQRNNVKERVQSTSKLTTKQQQQNFSKPS